MKPLELDILWMDANQVELKGLGIEIDETVDNGMRKMTTFYHVEGIFSTEKYGIDCTCIMVSGEEYICPRPYKEVKQLIEDNL